MAGEQGIEDTGGDSTGHLVDLRTAVYANAKFGEFIGHTPEEVQAFTSEELMEAVHPEDRPGLAQRHMDGVAGKPGTKPFLFRVEKVTGYSRWVEALDQSIEYAGEPAIMAIIQDVTARIETESALRHSEEKYRALVEESSIGIVIAQGNPPRPVFQNEVFAKIFGYTHEEMLALPAEKLPLLLHPEDRESYFKEFQLRLEGNFDRHPFILRILRKDGQTRWLEISWAPVEFEGKPAVQSTFMDVTEKARAEVALKNSEQKYRALTEHSIQGLTVLTGNPPRIRYANQALLSIIGYGPEDLQALSSWEM
ncbi:MAG: PAS domain-containing protein, partial [Planctomycetota bacterium]